MEAALRGGLGVLLATLCLALTGCATVDGFPPFYETEEGLPHQAAEDRAAFGLVTTRREADGRVVRTVRPLWTDRELPSGDEQLHVLPPIAYKQVTAGLASMIVWPFYFDTSAGNEEERETQESDDDTWLFPLAAWGEEPGEGSYLAVMPFGGTLKGKLLADEIDIYGFPLYIETRAGEWESSHVLWPLIAWGSGDGREHFRILPFYSASDSENGSRRSVAWPIVHWSEGKLPDGREVSGWFVFPLVGHTASEDASYEQTTVLYPFFEWAHDDVTGYEQRSVLWPFHVWDHRPGVSEKEWWWPFWGKFESETERATFYLWPLGWDQEQKLHDGWERRQYFVPFWMQSERGVEPGVAEHTETRVWPFYASAESADGSSKLRFPEILPFFGWEAGETVYSELLNLVRYESDAEGVSAWDGPFGIVRYRRDESGNRTLRLFWWIDLPLGRDESS
jgi:hypothetical protein